MANCTLTVKKIWPSAPNNPPGFQVDVSDDGVVDGDDAYAYRGSLADPLGSGLSPAGTAKCAVIAGAGGCSIVNVTVLLRAFESVEPPIEQACAAAGPN